MWRAIIINDMFHDVANIYRDEYAWLLALAPENLLHGHGDCLMEDESVLNLISYKDQLDYVRPIFSNHRYDIGTTTKAETSFTQWHIASGLCTRRTER